MPAEREPGQQVQRQRQELERQEDQDQVGGRDQQGHPGGGEQQQRVVLGAVLPAPAQVDGRQHDADAAAAASRTTRKKIAYRSVATMPPRTVGGPVHDQFQMAASAREHDGCERDPCDGGVGRRGGRTRPAAGSSSATPTRISSGATGPKFSGGCSMNRTAATSAITGRRLPARAGRGSATAWEPRCPTRGCPGRTAARSAGTTAEPVEDARPLWLARTNTQLRARARVDPRQDGLRVDAQEQDRRDQRPDDQVLARRDVPQSGSVAVAAGTRSSASGVAPFPRTRRRSPASRAPCAGTPTAGRWPRAPAQRRRRPRTAST